VFHSSRGTSIMKVFVWWVVVAVAADFVLMTAIWPAVLSPTSWPQTVLHSLLLAATLLVLCWCGLRLRAGSGALTNMARSRAIVDVSIDAIVTVDGRGRIESFNPAATHLFGWTEREVVGKPFEILIDQAARDRNLGAFADDLGDQDDSSRTVVREMPTMRKDGSAFVADLTLAMFGGRRAPSIVAVFRDITERKQVETALGAQAARFRSLIDNSTDIIALAEIDSSIAFLSPAFERVLGFQAAERLGTSAMDLIWPDDLARMRALFERAVGCPREVIPWELRVRHRDGGYRWLEGTATNLVDEPSVRGIVVNCHDVTDRKATTDALTQLSRAVEQSPVSIVITDPHGTINYVNPKFCSLTGYAAEEVIGQNPRLLKSGNLPPQVYEELWRAISSGREWRGELLNRKKNGELYWELASISPILDAEGRIACFVAVKEDITARKRSDEALRLSEEQFQSAFADAPIGKALVGLDGRFLRVNRVLCELVGYSNDELTSKTWQEITHRDDIEADANFAKSLMFGNAHAYELEKRYIHKNGQVIWTQLNVSVVRSRDGEPIHFISQIQDITQRRQVQEELGRRASELEWANQQLKQERAEREKVETELHLAHKLEAIGRLAAGIAHEINTPIQYIGDNTRFLSDTWQEQSKILAVLESLLRSPSAETPKSDELSALVEKADLPYLATEIPKAIQETLAGVERVANIVRAMKEFSHPGTGERTPVDLNKAIENTITVARNEWKYVADVVTEFDPQLLPVQCFPGELNQVFLNLIVNAAQAIGEDARRADGAKGTIRIATRDDGDWVEIRISDTGPGIPAAIQDKLFDPFFTTKPVGKGTGQGLAIARSVVVDKHRGTIVCQSEPGQGATFIIRLPMAAEPVAAVTDA